MSYEAHPDLAELMAELHGATPVEDLTRERFGHPPQDELAQGYNGDNGTEIK